MQVSSEAIISLVLYIVASTIGFVWWMATQTITLQFVREDLAKANKLLTSFEAIYATKVDLNRIEGVAQAAHKRIDELKK